MPFEGNNESSSADSKNPSAYAHLISDTALSAPQGKRTDVVGWVENNIAAPLVNTVAVNPYNALGNVLNPVSQLALSRDILPKAHTLTVAHANIGSSEWFAQNMSAGVGAAVLYTGLAKGTSKVLGAGGEALGSRGSALTWLSQSERAMVVGGTLYEGARDLNQGETRLGNMAGGAVGLTAFGLGNKYLSGLSGVDLAAARFGTGAVGSMAWHTTSKLVGSGELPSFKDLSDASLSGGTMNVLLPVLLGSKGAEQTKAKENIDPFKPATTLDATLAKVGALQASPEAGKLPEFSTVSTTVGETAIKAAEPAGTGAPESGKPSEQIGKPVEQTGKPVEEPTVPARNLPAGVDSAGTLTRVIEKPDGMKISLYSTGETVIEKPGEPTITRRPDGRVIKALADGSTEEYRPKSSIPLEERPLNVASGAYEAVGKQLSNFAKRPFTMDGMTYESVEGFYQGLKWPDAAKRVEVGQMSGPGAKSAGRGSPKSETFEYNGTEIKFGSPEHHALVKRAIRESLLQNPEMLNAFKETYPRPIEHKTGRRENPRSAFPGSTFTRILTELRQEFVDQSQDKPVATTAGDTAEKVEARPVESDTRYRPVSHLLSRIKDPNIKDNHPLNVYEQAFNGFDRLGSEVLSGGGDSVIIKLQDGNILKIGRRELPADAGSRPFDMPILEQGVRSTPDGINIRYYIQPEAQPLPQAMYEPFVDSIYDNGYRFMDPGEHQVGMYNGQPRLLDPWSVAKKPAR